VTCQGFGCATEAAENPSEPATPTTEIVACRFANFESADALRFNFIMMTTFCQFAFACDAAAIATLFQLITAVSGDDPSLQAEKS
tara:strand:- start:1855 stop:2109 length:255 start_codon:yes stop_codon:yes gene_type:complete